MVKLLPTAAVHFCSRMSSCRYRLLVNFSFSPAKLSFCASCWGHPSNNMIQDKNPHFFPSCHTVLLCVVQRGKPSENILPCFLGFSKKMQKAVIPDLAFSTHLICVRTFWGWEVTKFNLILQPFRNEHFHGLQKKSYSSQMNCPQKFEEKTGK